MNRLMFLIGTLSLLASTLCSCSLREEITFKRIEQIEFRGTNGRGDVMLVGQAIFHNPKPVGLHIISVRGTVYADGRQVGVFREDVASKMPAQSDFSIPLIVDIPVLSLLGSYSSILDGINGGKTEIPLRVEGIVKVKVAGKELAIPFEYEEVKGFSGF